MPTVPEPHCWLHHDVEVRPSAIAGEGLFARAPIPAGTVVSCLGGRPGCVEVLGSNHRTTRTIRGDLARWKGDASE